MSESKFKGGNALMNLEPKPRKILTFGEQPEPLATQPPNPATQIPESATQITTPEIVKEPNSLATQIPSYPNTQSDETLFPSRVNRRQKSIRLPVSKLPHYEDYQHANRHVFRDFQDLVEYALDWVTSQPVTQLPKLPNTQPPALINKEINNQLIINDDKAKRMLARYAEVTGRPVRQKDLEAFAEVAHLDESVIEKGIADSPKRAKESGHTINGFRYCLFSIFDAARNVVAKPGAAPSVCDRCKDHPGVWYPEGYGKGVAPCNHESSKSDEPAPRQ